MRFQNPIADINDVNILFDDDVARENAIVDPISEAAFVGRSVRPLRALDVTGQVVRFTANNFSDSSRVDAADHFDEWRTIANLKADVEAEFSFGTFADVYYFQSPGNIDGHR